VARSWPVTPRKRAVLAVFDTLTRPVAALALRRRSHSPEQIARILVLELWHMGDVVLATPVLRRLREMYPSASVTLLAKAHALDLLEASGLVDEVIPFDFPWTARARKYTLSRYYSTALSDLLKRLRAARFDLTLDSRMDLRSNILTYATRAPRRVGYDFGGGGYLLTDALPEPPPDRHKVEDWLELLKPLGCSAPSLDPALEVSDSERLEAQRVLRSYGFSPGDVIVAIHPGGSHELKRWPVDRFENVARTLSGVHRVRLLVLVDPRGTGATMQLGPDAVFLRTSLREMMALLTQCDLLVCNDSGPMHIAAALGVPVVAVFQTGNPSAYGPRGLNHSIVGRGAPWNQATDVPVEDVLAAAEAQVRRIDREKVMRNS
jgi:heptosyltransferase-2